MRFLGDLHIHSHFSLATSRQLVPQHLDAWARLKGISLVGTGDFTHPGWLQELKQELEPAEPGLFRLKPDRRLEVKVAGPRILSSEVRFLLSAEISSIYKKNGKVRKVHSIILAPDFGSVERLRMALLKRKANLTSDGRPILGLDAKALLEMTLEASEEMAFIPAHIWTPWFSVLGSKSGFDCVEECFDELTGHITAVETGLSTDPPMNWTCSFLDAFTLVSNSDAHSPDRLGRNANVFNTALEYSAIVDALKTGDPERFHGTIDMFPQEGKYHYDGHRKCSLCWSPLETLDHRETCPQCGRKVTVGVMYRVAQLGDRDDPELRPNLLPFSSIIPLKEILAEISGVGPSSKQVDRYYHSMLQRFGPELEILLESPLQYFEDQGDFLVAEAVRRMRERRVIIQEGYDGEYGIIRVFQNGEVEKIRHANSLFLGQEQLPPLPPRKLINFDLRKFRRIQAQNGSEPVPSQLPLDQAPPPSGKNSTPADLDADQKKAASHDKGPVLITAGPGTGKTRTLTHRIAYLIQERKADPDNILAITFTNKAAAEIETRLKTMTAIKKGKSFPRVSTFHALGCSILREHAAETNRSRNFFLLDEKDRLAVIRSNLHSPKEKPGEILKMISTAKQNFQTADDLYDPTAKEYFQNYMRSLEDMDAFDLDDCITQPILLFERMPDILAAWRERFQWILIDEFQDINAAQYRLIRTLMPGQDPNLTVIGDPNQAIYGFRGSDVNFIRDFSSEFPKAGHYSLGKSYRCSQTILQASSQVVPDSGLGRGFLRGLQAGVKITIVSQSTDRSEAEYVARSIEEAIGGLRFFSMDSDITIGHGNKEIQSLSDIAILCRIKEQMGAMEKALNDHSIPYQTVGKNLFHETEPVRTVLDLLKIRLHPGNLLLQKRLNANSRIRDTEQWIKSDLPRSTADAVALAVENLTTPSSEQDEGLEVLLDRAEEYGSDLPGFLHHVSLGTPADSYRPELEQVSVMTLHASKGLEFKWVYIIGCEDGLLPYSLFGRKSDPDEERRLLYVGMTRAEKRLFLSHAGKRFLSGQEFRLKRSPFLNNIQEELVRLDEQAGGSRPKERQMKLF